MSSSPAWSTEQVPGQPRLHRETLSRTATTPPKKKCTDPLRHLLGPFTWSFLIPTFSWGQITHCRQEHTPTPQLGVFLCLLGRSGSSVFGCVPPEKCSPLCACAAHAPCTGVGGAQNVGIHTQTSQLLSATESHRH